MKITKEKLVNIPKSKKDIKDIDYLNFLSDANFGLKNT